MKKTIICTVMMAFAICAVGQQDNSKPPMTSQEYLAKSKDQKTTAWVLLGLGVACIGTSILIASEPDYFLDSDITGFAITFLGGSILTLTSIPVFISSGNNKRRGMNALTYIKIEEVPLGHGITPMHTVMPAVAVKVRF